MKKGLALVLVAMIIMISTVAFAYTPGTYTATANGMGGEFLVSVTFDENAALSIEIGAHKETPNLGTIPLEQLPEKIIAEQSVSVDIVAGATITSNALLLAVKDCVAQAGGDIEAWTAKRAVEEIAAAEDVYTDIVIVGGGAAGLTAGINAKYNDVENVILLEKMSFCGGSTALSSGVMTRVAIDGDPEGTMTRDEMYNHLLSMASEQVEQDQLALYVDESADTWRWFTSLEGGEVTNRYHNTPENVYSTYPDGNGQGVINVLENEAVTNGVDIRKSHNVTSLLTDENGKVTGVQCINADGAEQKFYAKAVILATGGFANSEEMLKRFGGTNAGIYVERKGAGGANGDGIIMAENVGAKLVFGDNWDTSGMNNIWNSQVDFYASQNYGMIVNDEGKRFVGEDLMLPRIYEEMVNLINAGHVKFHVVMTMEGFEMAGGTQEAVDKAITLGELVKYDSVEALAKGINVSVENLKATIAAYGGTNDEMGKAEKYTEIFNANGPFYAAPSHPVRSGTMGGIAINTKSEVLDNNNQPIENLYAAGEVANGTFFGNYYYICGNMVMHAMITGQKAGINAAVHVK